MQPMSRRGKRYLSMPSLLHHRKKQFKTWIETSRPIRMLHLVMGAARPMGYRCASCKRHVGFYQAIGRNCFKIEPLPPGALAIYDRDPDVAAIVIPK
jgi:hypothetical protein